MYSEGLVEVTFQREVYEESEAFVALEWKTEDGGSFSGAEYVRVQAGRLREIIVVNNSPSFGDLLS